MHDNEAARGASGHLTHFLAIGTFWAGLLVSGCMLAAAMFLSS